MDYGDRSYRLELESVFRNSFENEPSDGVECNDMKWRGSDPAIG